MTKSEDFYVGMAKADITPALDCLLYGYPSERHAARVMDQLSVGVVAVKQGEETVLLISAEICEINREKCEEIRKAIGEVTGVKWENIIYATVHTHSGPVTHTNEGWGEADDDYLDKRLTTASVEAAKKALASMQPAVMGIGTVDSMAGVNRRQVTADGEVILGQNPDGPYDPIMTVIHFQAVSGEKIGSIVHFAAHPTAAAENLSITRDWPGLMVDRIEELSGAPCMYINGAEGDVGPRLSNGKTTGDESYVEEIGLVAAADAEKAYRSIDTYKTPSLRVSYGSIQLPFIEPPSIEAVEERIEAMGDPEKLIEVDITKYAQLQKIKAVYESGNPFPEGMEIPQTLIAIGDLALVPASFEAFCNIALSIREKSPYQFTLLLGLTGGCCGYLPTEDQIPYGGYEVDSFHAAGVISFVDNADKYMIDQNVELLNKMHR